MGSNKVMQVALGLSESDEIRLEIYSVSKLLHGGAGLVFTNMPKEDVEWLFDEYQDSSFFRMGSIATQKVRARNLSRQSSLHSLISHEMEPFLPKQGDAYQTEQSICEGL